MLTLSRALPALVIAVLVGLTGAPAARADSVVLSITDASGREDPVDGIGRTFTFRTNTAVPKRLYVKVRRPGGAPCAPSAQTDAGEPIYRSSSGRLYPDRNGWQFYGDSVNGDATVSQTGTWVGGTGTFMFCYWLADSSAQTSTPMTQNVTFRAMTGTVSASVSPASLLVGQSLTVTFAGSSEGPTSVYARYRPAGGAPCAATHNADSGTSIELDNHSVNGTFSRTATIQPETPGTYQVCTWMADTRDSPAIAGPQITTFTVTAPPAPAPPCVVPSLTPGTPLAAVTQSLTASGCRVGKRRYVASKRYRRGSVIKFDTATGAQLQTSAPVGVLLSSGAPCVVPQARRGMRLSTARSRLARSGCRAGAVRYVKSRRKRGTVVRFSPSSGQRLSPRSTVKITVSRGLR